MKYNFENQADALRAMEERQNPWYDNKRTYTPKPKRERKNIEDMTDEELLDLYMMCRDEIIELNQLKADTRTKYKFLKVLKMHSINRGIIDGKTYETKKSEILTLQNRIKELQIENQKLRAENNFLKGV